MDTEWYKRVVLYGLDVSKFYDSDGDGTGDLRGLIAKLDYLQELGVNCLWLLPFYPTANRDNGYDITNHVDVDPAVGTLADFRSLVYACKTKGIRLVVDLVMHHTSNMHPWFIASSMRRSSKYSDYYLWRQQISPEIQTQNAFPTVEDGVWKYEENAHAYYRHQFYHFEPDLNIANDDVKHEIYNIIDFWLAMGVDGFRVDAATFVLNQKGILTPGESGSEFFEDIRKHISAVNPEAVLIGEADVEFHEIPDYFGTKTKMQMLKNFLLNNEFFYSLASGKAEPIATCLADQKALKAKGVWVNFIRNLDELNLMHLDAKEQKLVMEKYAPEPNMLIFDRGIRRRLPTMLDGRTSQIKMAYSLLFALPGVPMYMYGDEIGMGDDLARGGRNSVRLPMQWNDERNGGFSTTEKNVASEDENYGYSVVNAATQQNRKTSMWNFFHGLTTLRKDLDTLHDGRYELVETGNEHLLGLRYEKAGEKPLYVFHNLAGSAQEFELAKSVQLNKSEPVFGQELTKAGKGLRISGYGFSWFRV